jgi:predicted secreted protein
MSAVAGHGTVVTVTDGTNTTTAGYITNISGPNESRDSIDVSTMDSTNKWRQFLDGMLDAGEASFDLVYDGASGGNANKLYTLKTTTAMTWQIQFKDNGTNAGSKWACSGFMTGLGHGVAYDGAATQTMSLKFTGAPTYTDIA